MIERIGKKHPTRLFIREWIDTIHPGLDGKRLAARMGISPSTFSKLLKGEMKMTTEYLAGFADLLDKSVPELFLDPKTPTQEELQSAGTPEELRAAIRLVQMAKTGTNG